MNTRRAKKMPVSIPDTGYHKKGKKKKKKQKKSKKSDSKKEEKTTYTKKGSKKPVAVDVDGWKDR